MSSILFFYCYAAHQDLHSFPTRRSSDLNEPSRSNARMNVSWVKSCARASSPASRKARRYTRRSEEHTSELQSRPHLVCRLLLEKKKIKWRSHTRSMNALQISQSIRVVRI